MSCLIGSCDAHTQQAQRATVYLPYELTHGSAFVLPNGLCIYKGCVHDSMVFIARICVCSIYVYIRKLRYE